MTTARAGSIVHGPTASSGSSPPVVSHSASHSLLRALPSVDATLQLPEVHALITEFGHTLVVHQLRGILSELRQIALSGNAIAFEQAKDDSIGSLIACCEARVANRMQRVLNLTGTVITQPRTIRSREGKNMSPTSRASNNLELISQV